MFKELKNCFLKVPDAVRDYAAANDPNTDESGATLPTYRDRLIGELRQEQAAMLNLIDTALQAIEHGSHDELGHHLSALDRLLKQHAQREQTELYKALEAFVTHRQSKEAGFIRSSRDESRILMHSVGIALERYAAMAMHQTQVGTAPLVNLRIVLLDAFLDKQEHLYPLYQQYGSYGRTAV
ncbi:MAG: hypothetical protein R3202_00010 [Candidatus Competibacterales bacterium]|nr:hypothetical protein [Candidatus Competibacterales bacterium]